ncbi:helix-turn-helix domain-containing protein, partial [Bifidobacterium longum]|nr:helix-turn-helix domain-containing protein [Bifidobacterium longum subsp. longum]
QYETDKRTPNIYVLIKLADIFGVTIDYLIKRSDSNNVNSSKE